MKREATKRQIFENIMENSGSIQNCPVTNENELRIASAVISMYIKLMYEAVFRGFMWTVPRFGTLSLEISPTKKRQITPKYYKKQIDNSHYMNYNLIDHTVSFVFSGNFFNETKCRFRAAKVQREKLTQLLFNTDFPKQLKICRSKSS